MPIRPFRPLLLSTCLLAFASGAAAQTNDRGLDARNLDAKTPACTDFYQHANGSWLKANPVPPGFGSWGLFEELQRRNLLQQRELLEAAASAPQGDLDTLLGNLYASGMDEARIEAAGAQPLAALYARIDKLQKPKDFAPLLADMHARGLPLLFEFGAADDVKDPTRRIAYANQGGLGMPDRDYYLRADPATATLLAAYRAYVERLSTLGGSPNAARDAGWVLDIETRLARASLSLLQLRDPTNSYRPTPIKELIKRFPAIDWKKFLKAQDLAKLPSVSVAHTAFFSEVEALSKSLPPEQWRAYFRFHVAHALSPYLARGFGEAHEALYLRTLRGTQEPLPRWQRVMGSVDALVGHGFGRRYAEKYLPPASKQAAIDLVQSVRSAFRARIEASSWLGTLGRTRALAKLDAMDLKIGHGDRWPSYDGLAFSRDSYVGNVLAAVAWRHKRQMATVGKPREESQWPQPAQAVNLYYDPARNQLVLPAGFLQPPVFDPAADAALNYGALGALVAHEMSHGFDVIGSTFDATGAVAPAWEAADATAFALRTKPLEMQYDAYTALGPIKVSGRLTLAENIADLAGIEIAWNAFLSTQPDAKAIEGYSPRQRFFLAWAQLWRRNYLDAELTLLLRTDVHAPAKFRVNGPLANFAPFSAEFKCKAGAGMVRKDAERVTIW
jgi:putative endopeptidase